MVTSDDNHNDIINVYIGRCHPYTDNIARQTHCLRNLVNRAFPRFAASSGRLFPQPASWNFDRMAQRSQIPEAESRNRGHKTHISNPFRVVRCTCNVRWLKDTSQHVQIANRVDNCRAPNHAPTLLDSLRSRTPQKARRRTTTINCHINCRKQTMPMCKHGWSKGQ